MIQACCFDPTTCRNLEPEECLNAGGLPRGDWSWCDGTVPPYTGYHLVVCRYQACCYQLMPPWSEWLCLDTTPHNCSVLVGQSMGWGTSCQHINCSSQGVHILCCMPDGVLITYEMDADQCNAVGGTVIAPGDECLGPEVPDDCHYARLDQHPEGMRYWHRDVCQNSVLEETRRYVEQESSASFHFRRGYFELVTRRPVRAMSLSEREDEPCQHQFVPVVIEDDGYASAAFCTDRAIEGLTRTMVIPAIVNENDEFGKAGYARFYGSYQTPLWTEAIFDSPLMICGGGER